MENKHSELTEHETTGDILRSVLGTHEENRPSSDIIIALADEGFLDEHQTRTALEAVATQLLDTLYGEDSQDAD